MKKEYFTDISDDFYICFGNFLDEFYRSGQKRREEMARPEPQEEALTKEHAAFLSAAIHKLCDDYGVTAPEWVFKDKYFLKDPFFSPNVKGDMRLFFMYVSPPEFKIRNIFVDNNVLKRV